MNTFEALNSVNVSDKTETKNGLTYLSWAWAWGELKKRYPDSYYTVYENPQGYNYFTDGRTCWVKTGVTLVDCDKSIELIEYLPIMDFRNKSISADAVTSYDVNKSIQRSLTKAIARHGLGLYIYAGEDLPEGEQAPKTAEKAPAICEECGKTITATKNNDYDTIIRNGMHFNKHLCYSCLMQAFKAEKAAEAKKALAADAEAHSA